MKTIDNFQRLFFFSVAAVLTFTSTAHAQNEIPDGPLLRPAPEFSQWTITLSYPDERGKKADDKPPIPGLENRVHQIVTTKTKNIVHEETIDGKGVKSEKWYVGSTQYRKDPGATVWYENSAGTMGKTQQDFHYTPLPPSGFRDLDWINADAYAGTIAYGKGKCLVFIPGGGSATNAAVVTTLPTVALIDSETRLPVEVHNGGIIRVFQFADQAPAMQTLPPDLAEEIKKGDEGRARLDQRPPRPY